MTERKQANRIKLVISTGTNVDLIRLKNGLVSNDGKVQTFLRDQVSEGGVGGDGGDCLKAKEEPECKNGTPPYHGGVDSRFTLIVDANEIIIPDEK